MLDRDSNWEAILLKEKKCNTIFTVILNLESKILQHISAALKVILQKKKEINCGQKSNEESHE